MSQEKLMNVLLGPHVSEKSARIAETANQFVFRVRRDATSGDIKAAVELMFEVKVADVNEIDAVQERLTAVLREERGLAATDSNNFSIFSASTIVGKEKLL